MPKGKTTIALIATLDTKGSEVAYITQQIEELGCAVLVIDCGIRGEPTGVLPAVTREEIAEAAGMELEDLRRMGRGEAVHHMVVGLKRLVLEAHRAGRFDGVLSIGGLEGMTMGTAAMQVLPIGVPKLMVSPLAAGDFTFGPFTGRKDVMIMHSVIDILGINPVSRVIFDNALRAMVGMVQNSSGAVRWGEQRLIAVTMMGNTTPAVMRAKPQIEARGYELVIFHASGAGGPSMESLIAEGVFRAVLDYTPHEVTDLIAGGLCGNDPHRLEAAGTAGIPQVIVPGGTDYIVQGSPADIPERLQGRPYYLHNPNCALVRTSPEEMRRVGEFMAEKLHRARGPVAVLLPLRGLSMYCRPGEPMHDPPGDEQLFRVLRSAAGGNVHVEEIDAHINDPVCADRAVELLLGMLEGFR